MSDIEQLGPNILRIPELNKGMAFTSAERDKFHLHGLLPPRINTIDQQVTKVLNNLRQKANDLERYIYMMSLQVRNETLFFRTVMENLEELMPILYTPTVGQACQVYGHIHRRTQGLFIAAQDRGRIKDILRSWRRKEVRVIVVTDGERILGLGDLGVDGMGIPVGKLALYTACAGVPPTNCLPITLDVGTNNAALLNDPLYIGSPHPRLRDEEYDGLIEEFVQAVQEIYPEALLQFEDFANHNAFRLLEKYRHNICCFNDDIQGTGAVTLAGLYAATHLLEQPMKQQTFLFFGAGEAGTGIGEMVVTALQGEGLTLEEARARCWFVDSKGLVVEGREALNHHKELYAHPAEHQPNLLAAIQAVRPSVLIGTTGQPSTFTPDVLRTMAEINPRPIIFALSNPTEKAECTAQEAYTWTEGRGIFASGSPFAPVTFEGKTFVPGQGNNAYIFPGVGLGVLASEASRVTNEMFFAAAQTLAKQVSDTDLARGCVYPPLSDIMEVSARIAAAVAEVAVSQGLARREPPADWLHFIEAMQYWPEYAEYA